MKKNKKNMSTLGFILSAIGAAVGLGNIWRFPTHLMNHGGPAFLIPYLIAVLCLGLPLLILEINLGHKWRKAPVLFYSEYFGKHGRAFAWMQSAIQLLIGTFYAIIISWVLISAFSSLGIVDGFSLKDMQSSKFFDDKVTLNDTVDDKVLGNFSWIVFGGFAIIVFLTIFIVGGGLTGGIEKVNKIMVPILFLIIVGFFIYSLTFQNAGVGIRAIFEPNFDKLANPDAWKAAFGQALFTLSLGVSIIVIYSSVAPENGDNTNRAIIIMAGDTLIALLACVIVGATLGYGLGTDSKGESRLFVSALTVTDSTNPDSPVKEIFVQQGLVDWSGVTDSYANKAKITTSEVIAYKETTAGIVGDKGDLKSFTGGPTLIFRALPVTFHRISGAGTSDEANAVGKILASLFYLAVFFAAMSSMISLFEPTISNLIQGYGIKRINGVLIAGGLTFIFGFWFSFSGSDNMWDVISDGFFTTQFLLVSALLEIFFVAMCWKKLKPILQHNNKNSMFKLGRWFQFLLGFAFLLTLAIFGYGVYGFFDSIPLADSAHKAFYWGVGVANYLVPFLILVVGFGYLWKGLKKGNEINE